jgi:hypothetical protein
MARVVSDVEWDVMRVRSGNQHCVASQLLSRFEADILGDLIFLANMNSIERDASRYFRVWRECGLHTNSIENPTPAIQPLGWLSAQSMLVSALEMRRSDLKLILSRFDIILRRYVDEENVVLRIFTDLDYGGQGIEYIN